jgi:Arm DNA-binding domain/Phage integrase, N-terminal SAM-like domain
MPHLDDDLVRSLEPPAKGSRITFDANPEGVTDAAVTGFGIRVTATGFKAFTLSYRNENGEQKRYTIGPFPRWKTERARKEARRLREDVIDNKGDPQAEKIAKRNEAIVNELLDKFMAEHVEKECRPSTIEGYGNILKLHIRPALGKKKVAAVTSADIRTMFRDISDAGHKHQANRALAIISKAFNLAIGEWDMRPDGVNPCRGIKRHREEHRHRPGQIGAHLTPEELTALGAAMAKHPDVASVRAI